MDIFVVQSCGYDVVFVVRARDLVGERFCSVQRSLVHRDRLPRQDQHYPCA
jgi:hypothetical protein